MNPTTLRQSTNTAAALRPAANTRETTMYLSQYSNRSLGVGPTVPLAWIAFRAWLAEQCRQHWRVPQITQNRVCAIHPSRLQPGDIILSTSPAILSLLIRKKTRSAVSHAALYIGNQQIVEAIGGGVTRQPLASALADDCYALVLRLNPGLTPLEAKKVVYYVTLQAALGKRYDLAEALLPPRGGGTAYRFFCSELVLRAFAYAGRPLTSSPLGTPGDVAIARDLVYLGHLKVPAGEPLEPCRTSSATLRGYGFSGTAAPDGSFGYYFRRCMASLGLPVPTGLFDTTVAAAGTISKLVEVASKFGSRVTIGELLRAGTLSEALTVVAGLTAAGYAGACVGCFATATGQALSGGLSLADAWASLRR